jgi:T4 RnlA family RNA ligase
MNINEMSVAMQRDEIRVKHEEINGESFNIICYMVATRDLWDIPGAIECRGITFNDQGNCVCRTMPKFFNLNENKFTQLVDLNFDNAKCYEKLDGSMVTPVKLKDGSIRFKTKKSFYSDVAHQANCYFRQNQNYIDFCNYLIDNNMTPSFEFQSPDAKIVVDVAETVATLILVRQINTGADVSLESLASLTQQYNIPVVYGSKLNSEHNSMRIQDYINLSQTIEGIEGWVFVLASGQRVKLKTKWYLDRHRLTTYHERNIVDMIIDESLDDIMPVVSLLPGATETVEAIELKIAHQFKEIDIAVSELLDLMKLEPDIKSTSLKYSKHTYFSVAVRLYNGQEADVQIKKLWKKLHYHEWSTRPLFWGFDTDA